MRSHHWLFTHVTVLITFSIAQQSGHAQSVTGSGTAGRLAKWTGTTSIGNSILLIESGSYFGVGTNSPQRELHMVGVLRIDRSNTPGIFLHQLGQKTFFVGVQATGVNQGEFLIGDVGSAVSGVGTKRLVINNAGNVGIGVLSPASKLTVGGIIHSTTGGIRFPDNTTQTTATLVGPPGPQGPQGAQGPPGPIGGSGTPGRLPVWTSTSALGSSSVFQQSNGNIGIGTTTPTSTLHVAGDVNLNGIIRMLGQPIVRVPGGAAPGVNNLAVGFGGLNSATSGISNIALGAFALRDNTSGSGNTAAGVAALNYNTTGGANTAIGENALLGNRAGSSNTAVGVNAMSNGVQEGHSNTAIGVVVLQNNTTGSNNTAIGVGALRSNTTGLQNTAVGAGALPSNFTGSMNIAVGDAAANNVSSGNSNNIHIGSQGISSDSNTIRIGEFRHTSFFAAGIRGVITGQANAIPVVIDSNGQLGTLSSSGRYKRDIADLRETAGVMRLRPVTFKYKQSSAATHVPLEYGLIAEEVAEVYPDAVVYSPDGQPEAVQYHKINVMLLNEVQKQHRIIELLTERVSALEALVLSHPR